MIKIREENKADVTGIREINVKAFGQSEEADIIDKLRSNCTLFISLIAELDNKIVGYILFTLVTIESENGMIEGTGLAPMAILPGYQKQGIGASLVEEGFKRINQNRCPFVVVLGHSDYYPRFGFEPASKYGVRCEWEVPDEAFMIKIFDKSKLDKITGIAKYRIEFNESM